MIGFRTEVSIGFPDRREHRSTKEISNGRLKTDTGIKLSYPHNKPENCARNKRSIPEENRTGKHAAHAAERGDVAEDRWLQLRLQHAADDMHKSQCTDNRENLRARNLIGIGLWNHDSRSNVLLEIREATLTPS